MGFMRKMLISTVKINYLAVGGSGTDRFLISENGQTWVVGSTSGIPAADTLLCCFKGDGYFAIGTNGAGGAGCLFTSAEGLTWTANTGTLLTQCYDICSDGSYFYLVGTGATCDVSRGSSLSGSFTGMATTFSVNGTSIVYNTHFVMTGASGDANTLGGYPSGMAWYGYGNTIFSKGNCCIDTGYSDPAFVSGGSGSNSLAYSNDNGQIWTGVGTSVLTECFALANTGTLWAGGSGTYKLAKSTDAGITWTGISYPGSGTILAMLPTNDYMIIFDSAGAIYAFDAFYETWQRTDTTINTTVRRIK
jgi:hypothetical protein